MLMLFILLPLFAAFFICFFFSFRQFCLIRNLSLLFSLAIFNVSVLLLLFFDPSVTFFQCIQDVK